MSMSNYGRFIRECPLCKGKVVCRGCKYRMTGEAVRKMLCKRCGAAFSMRDGEPLKQTRGPCGTGEIMKDRQRPHVKKQALEYERAAEMIPGARFVAGRCQSGSK